MVQDGWQVFQTSDPESVDRGFVIMQKYIDKLEPPFLVT